VTLQDLLAKFDYAKESGGHWMAKCPAHDDRTPSLSVKEGQDGAILLKCHAGCTTEAIVAALGLQMADLFPERDPPVKREIVATYDYCGMDAALRFQVVRFQPKDFRQRAPDGKGDWVWSVKGVGLCPYKWPELKDHPAVVIVEGERDVEAAWKIGLPATCNPMGAGKWRDEYTAHLKQVGVQRVAIVPDNDAVGREHAEAVASSCQKAGLGVRIVHLPGVAEHGDLSDYLATHTKAELVTLMRNAPAWAPEGDGPDRVFEVVGDQRYRMTTRSTHIRLELQHLRRESHNAWGELRVAVNGFFPGAKHFRDGLIHVGDWNLSAVQSRQTRAKLLAERSGDKDVDWYGLLEEFAIETLAAESAGTPAVRLRDVPEPDESHVAEWDVGGIPILADLPMVMFGDASSGKSLLALWIAGTLATRGIPVLYADWEFSATEQRKRFRRLFEAMPPEVHYVRCDRPLSKDADRLVRIVQDRGCQYVVSDSIGFAADGPAETHEVAMRYFEGLRRLRVGSLSIAHIAKYVDEGQQPTVFGSAFFKAGGRSIWFVHQAQTNPSDAIRVGLYHHKSNLGPKLPARAYSLTFARGRIAIEPVDIYTVPDLAALLPLQDRLLAHLRQEGLITVKRAAEDLSVTQKAIYATVARHKREFVKDGEKINAAQTAAPDGGALEF
jgi:hypothetical protein